MDKKEFEKKLAEKRAKKGKEDETISMITSGDIVEEIEEPERLGIITTSDILGYKKRSTDRPTTVITTSNAEEYRARYLKDMEEKKNAKD